MSNNTWTFLGSRDIAEFPVIRVRSDHYRFEPTGDETDFVVCDSPDWVLVVPVTKLHDVLFVRQFRHGVQQTVLEFPGGIVDRGESPAEAARRELKEETGYVAAEWRSLGKLMPNPALNTASAHVFLAQSCYRSGTPQLDVWEQVELVRRPLDTITAMICSGELCHAQMIAAFALAQCVPQ